MSNCNWKKIKQKSASLAEWKCNTCGEVGYSSHKHGPINCLKNLSGSTGKFTTGLPGGQKVSHENKFNAKTKRILLFVFEINLIALTFYLVIVLDFGLLRQYNAIEFAKSLLFVFSLLFYLHLRHKRINRCPRCEKRGALVTTDVSDTPLGYGSELYSYDANNFSDQPKDIRYETQLIEFGMRSKRRKCKNCGFSVVTEKKYKKRF